jgi:chaperonin cofactor prefoldin
MEIQGKTEELLVKQLKTCERNMQELTNSIKKLQAKGISNIVNKIITENFPNLEKAMPIQV